MVNLAMEILHAGYDMLMEKPVVSNEGQLREIAELAKAKKAKVFVCHVLRYTSFYRTIKEYLNAGAIGDMMWIGLQASVMSM